MMIDGMDQKQKDQFEAQVYAIKNHTKFESEAKEMRRRLARERMAYEQRQRDKRASQSI